MPAVPLTQPGPHPVTHPAPGVGLDFNSQLVDGIMKVRGANYFSVHSPGEPRGRGQ